MKRGQPLARRAPLQSRTTLHVARTLQRSGPLSPVSATRKRDNQERTRVVNGLRMLQRGICPRCRRGDAPLHGHERVRRSQGGSIIAPECALCDPCNSAVASSPRVSGWNGWAVSPKWPHDPLLEVGTARDLFGNVVVFADLSASFEDAS